MTMRHEALLYGDDRDYVAGIRQFVDGGARAGEPVLVAVPAPRLALLRRELPDPVRFVDMTEAGRNPGRIIPAVLHAFIEEHPGARVRIVGEPIWPGRPADIYPRCVQHEALINLALADRPAAIMCPYDTRGLAPEAVDDALRTHPVVVESGVRRGSPRYAEPEAVVAAFNRPLPEPHTPPAVLIFGAGELAAVRRFVREHGARAGLPPDRVDDLLIVVNELATNALVHGRGPGTLRLWPDDDGVMCEVLDRGRPAGALLLAGRVPPALYSEHGRGLVLVNLLCDAVHVHAGPDATAVRLHVLRSPAGDPGSPVRS